MHRGQLVQVSEATILEIFGRYVPEGTVVYVFGSRARSDNRWNSDYDLWLDADLPRETIAQMEDDIEESIVPFEVDLVTTTQLRGEFGKRVVRETQRWM